MGQAKLPLCAWCGYETHGQPNRKQDLVQKQIKDGVWIWLHLQCEQIYRELGAPQR
jgi:hypothetical protein